MKNTLNILIILTLFLSCKAQQVQTTLPKLENYSKGELEIKVETFGSKTPIIIGKITADGTIHFNWNSDISSIEDPDFYMSSIKNTVGMTFCNDKQIEINNKAVKVVEAKNLFLYKNGQQVGVLLPATKKEIEDNAGSNRYTSLVLGSTISWFYSDNDGAFKATCTVNQEYEGSYHFKEISTYNIQLKKGWNMIQTTLVEKEDWNNGVKKGSLPKTISKTSITKIPSNINWYLKYWGE